MVPWCSVERSKVLQSIREPYTIQMYKGTNVLNWHMSPSISVSISIIEIEGLLVPKCSMHAFIVNII